jgi:hypothetical protein
MSVPNANPINSLYSLNGIPLFTYGMIGITTIALACVTMLDDSNKSFAKDEGFEQTKSIGSSNPFTFFSSNKSEEATPEESKKEASMFSSFSIGKTEEPPVESKKEGSILPSFSNEPTEESKKEESILPSFSKEPTEESKKEESILPSFTNEPTEKEQPKQGGKKYRKTKYNLQKYQHNRSKKVFQPK